MCKGGVCGGLRRSFSRKTKKQQKNKRIMTNNAKRIVLAIAAAASIAQANAAVVTWTDWATTSSGSLNFPGGSVGVTLSSTPGSIIGLDTTDNYYNNGFTGGTAPSGTYGGLIPSDLIQVDRPGTFTLNFATPVVNPYLALVSVGQPGYGVTYDFGASSFSVVSFGPNYWGYGGYSTSGNKFTGTEFNGVLQFAGTYSSLSFTTDPNENWHGFNVGATSAVPEPSTYLAGMSALGMLGLFGWRNRK